MYIQKQDDGTYIVVTASGSIVAGPYGRLCMARRAYPRAKQGAGVLNAEWLR